MKMSSNRMNQRGRDIPQSYYVHDDEGKGFCTQLLALEVNVLRPHS